MRGRAGLYIWLVAQALYQPRPDFPQETIHSVNPKIAASFLAGEGTRFHGAFGTGIRPPDAFEIAFTDNSGDGYNYPMLRSFNVGLTITF